MTYYEVRLKQAKSGQNLSLKYQYYIEIYV